MNGEIRRTFSCGRPSVWQGRALPQAIIWLEVQTVSLSPSQAAMVACGSIVACAWSGVV